MTTTTEMEINTNGGGGGGCGIVDPGSAGVTETVASSSSVTPAPICSSGLQKNVVGVGSPSNNRVLDATKRKKLKSRSSVGAASTPTTTTAPSHTIRSSGSGSGCASASKSNVTGPNYSKDHLDAWLENCLRDATNAQLSSSSEFLDFTPPTAKANKQIFVTQSSVQQQQQQQQQQQPQQQQQQQQQQFLMRSHSQPYSMGTGTPFSLGIQRHSQALSHRYPMLFPPQSYPNGYGLGMGYCGDGGQEFASLPPLVNMMGGTGGGGAASEHEQNSTDVLDGSNPNFSRGFRFSDPCLLNPSDNDTKLSGQNTPDCRNGNTNTNDSGCDLAQQNKFFAALMEQINLLHDTNSKICRNLHETKGAYTPGMMTDVVREVKEAARVREDALLSRVKSMVEERQWSLNEGNVRILRDIDDLKSHVMQLRLERKETHKRLSHLEAENKYLRQALASCYNQRQAYHDIIYENERARGSRKPFPNGGGGSGGGGGGGSGAAGVGPRRAQSFNLHYGIMHQTPTQTTQALEEDDEIEEDNEAVSVTTTKRLSCSSSESRSNGLPTPTVQHSQYSSLAQQQQAAQSPPTFALIAEHLDRDSALPPPLLPRKKEHAQLKRELGEAAAARKEANQRIIAWV
ncbi:uncharacterized protein LOC117899009 isoform X7 [Drosophila subobscura]|uniref:uncharacterized protein LOC117899009 isoform X7 n=1 Tax=Drosophila subobscura TaxID=7241 RepID=UPI00155A0E02|nr:uncharacterized protein LOC117899009 isoform X7 [Drosophila subobscura]